MLRQRRQRRHFCSTAVMSARACANDDQTLKKSSASAVWRQFGFFEMRARSWQSFRDDTRYRAAAAAAAAAANVVAAIAGWRRMFANCGRRLNKICVQIAAERRLERRICRGNSGRSSLYTLNSLSGACVKSMNGDAPKKSLVLRRQ